MRSSIERNDGGFVMVWALLLMVVLLILGVSGIGTSIFESQMTANDALHKQSFFQADGGANVAGMLIEENVSCPSGFVVNNSPNALILNNIVVFPGPAGKVDFYNNQVPGTIPSPPVSDTNRDAYYFYNAPGNTHTNIKTYGTSAAVPGGALEMAAGYEGRGKGLAGGGGAVNYDTYSQYMNVRQSQSIVNIVWQHMVGFEGTCHY